METAATAVETAAARTAARRRRPSSCRGVDQPIQPNEEPIALDGRALDGRRFEERPQPARRASHRSVGRGPSGKEQDRARLSEAEPDRAGPSGWRHAACLLARSASTLLWMRPRCQRHAKSGGRAPLEIEEDEREQSDADVRDGARQVYRNMSPQQPEHDAKAHTMDRLRDEA